MSVNVKTKPGKWTRHIAVALTLLSVGGCAQLPTPELQATTRLRPAEAEAAQSKRDQLIGKWLGVSVTPDGHTIHWIKEHFSEGSYKATFRDYDPQGNHQDQVEVGYWGLSGPVYFTIMRGWVEGKDFRQANLTKAYYYDAYKVLEATQQRLEYQNLDTGQRFLLTRVSDDYVLPDSPPPAPAAPQPAAPAAAEASQQAAAQVVESKPAAAIANSKATSTGKSNGKKKSKAKTANSAKSRSASQTVTTQPAS